MSELIKNRFIQLEKFLFLFLSRKKTSNHDYRRILFLRKDGIGDAVMFLPSFKALKAKYPSCRIDLVNFKAPDYVLFAEKQVNVIEKPFHHFLNCLLKGVKYDRIVIFSGGRELRILKRFEKARNIAILTNISIYPQENYTDFYFRLMESVFGKLPEFNSNLSLIISSDEQRKADSLLNRIKVDNQRIIGLVIGSVLGWKKYSYWGRLINCIKASEELNSYQICLLGGRTGVAEARELSRESPDVFNLTDLTLREAMAFARNLDLVICSDGGFMHIANSLGVKTLALFGATDPACMIKWNGCNKTVAVKLKQKCSPCYSPENPFYCDNNLECMNINPNLLLPYIKLILKSKHDTLPHIVEVEN